LSDILSAPLWLVALVAAVAAPFFVAALQAMLEARLRRRTLRVLERAIAGAKERDVDA
jgi:hypothetical protein